MPSNIDLLIILLDATQLFSMMMVFASFKVALIENKDRLQAGLGIGKFDLPKEHIYIILAGVFLAFVIILQILITPPATPINNSYILDGLA